MRVALLLLCGATMLEAQTGSRADSAWTAGNRKLARHLFAEALRADPENSHATFRLAQLSEDRRAALELYRRYTELEPDDGWGWQALGDALANRGQTDQALAMYDRAVRLLPNNPEVESGRARLRRAQLARGPALEPEAGYSRDSDGNRTSRIGLRADWAAGRFTRLGVSGAVSRIGDGGTSHGLQEGYFRFTLSRRTALVALSAGAARLVRGAGFTAWVTPAGEGRLRWRTASGGTSFELRGQRQPLGTTPLLMEHRAMRDEGRATLQLPLGPLRFRVAGRAARLKALDETNTRLAGDGAVVVPLGWRGEVSVQYHRLRYREPTTLGYFAPERVETVEGGSYVEAEAGRLAMAMEVGAGAQRLREFGSAMGPWGLSLRGYAQIAIAFAAGRAIRMELEGYDAPFAPDRSTRSGRWRSVSVSTGIRWTFR
jgi:hypothetical protein